MIKRGKHGIIKLLSLCLTIAVLCTMIPSFMASAVPITSEPILTQYSVSPSSIARNSSFSMEATFQHYLTKEDYAALQSIKIDVSSKDKSIEVAGKRGGTYKIENVVFSEITEEVSSENEDTSKSGLSNSGKYVGIEYQIYIPESALEYVGRDAGVLNFKITYTIGKNTKEMNVQKTISECVKSESSSSSDDDDEDEPNDPIGTIFVVPQDAEMPQIQAGTTAQVNIPIKCSLMFGGVGSTQISVGALPEGLSFASPGATYQMIFNNNEPQMLALNLTAEKNLKDGVYGIPLKISYKYDNSVNVSVKTDEVTAYIRVLEADGSQEGNGKLLIDSYKLDRPQIKEGESFQLSVTIVNRDDSAYNNVTVSLEGLSTQSLTTDGMLNMQTIPTIKEGESQTVTFKLRANDSMETGSYEIGVNVAADGSESTSEGTSSAQSISAKIFVPIQGTKASEDDKSNASKPQIIIESYDYGGMSVVGGQEFTLKMTFRNTSRETAIENMKMTVGNPASESDTDVAAFTPAKSSNTFFIERIGPGETFSREIALYPKADASPKSYGVRISYKYEAVLNNARQELSDEETISIPLTQPDRFEVSDVVLSGPVYMGDSASLSISYVNMGKSSVYNLSVKLEGENFTSGDMDTYIGNVESGNSDSFDTTLNPEAPGTITGKAIFTYEGPDGNAKSVEKEFSCEVMEMPTYDDPGTDMPVEPLPEESGGLPGWAKWAIGGGCAVLLVAAVIVIRKIRKKRQAMLDLEDDDEGV